MSDPIVFQSPALAAAAGGFYLSGEDNFRLTTWGSLGSAVVTLEGRIVSPDGCTEPFVETQIPLATRAAKTSIFPAREGSLLNAQLRVSTGTSIGGTVGALLEIVRGREGGVTPIGTVLQGYVNSATRLAWPAPGITPLTSGAGLLRLIVGTDPAANVEILETVPTGARWKLRAFRFVLIADANAANRTVILTIDDGVTTLWETASAVLVTANQTVTYNAAPGTQFFTYAPLSYHLPLPGELWLPAGARIRTATANRQVGDNFGAPAYMVEEFLEQ